MRWLLLVSCAAACGRLGFDAVDSNVTPGCELPTSCTGVVFSCEPGTCYARCDNEETWETAAEQCRAWGGNLVTIETLAENACIATRISASTVWIGLTESTGTWLWHSGSPSSYRNWQPDQPDGVSYEGETIAVDCARLNDDGGNRWLDEDCPSTIAFVCER